MVTIYYRVPSVAHVHDAFYKLPNPRAEMQEMVFQEARGIVLPDMSYAEVGETDTKLAAAIQFQLARTMKESGYEVGLVKVGIKIVSAPALAAAAETQTMLERLIQDDERPEPWAWVPVTTTEP